MSNPFETLSEQTLREICRVHPTALAHYPELNDNFRMVPLLAADRWDGPSFLVPVLTAVLGGPIEQVQRFPRIKLPEYRIGWIERHKVELAAKQVLGLLNMDKAPDAIAEKVDRAVLEAVELGFVERRMFDEWRPGMPSGSGMLMNFVPTTYGLAQARNRFAKLSSDPALLQHAAPPRHAQPQTTLPATGSKPARPMPGHAPAQPAAEPPTPDSRKQPPAPPPQASSKPTDPLPPTAYPKVRLQQQGEPYYIDVKQKKPLASAEYDVVKALLDAGATGLSKDALENVRRSAREVIDNLSKDDDWKPILKKPGRAHVGYRILQ